MNAAVRLLLLLLLVVPSAVVAQGAASPSAPSLDLYGLRGGRHVGSAGQVAEVPRLRAGLGYAYTESVLDGTDRHQRAFGEIAASIPVRQYLQLGLLLDARVDTHKSDRGADDAGGAFATTLLTRHAIALPRATSIAPQFKLRFPAAESPGRGFKAASPELSLLASHLFADRYELSALAGYRFDRSRESVADPARLSAADRLGASLSKYDAALLGALVAAPFGPVTASFEWSWDVPVGGPRAIEGAMRLRAAAQLALGERLLPGIELGVVPSARPDPSRLVRIEPRFFVAASLGIVFAKPPSPAPRAPVSVAVETVPDSTTARLRVVDATGAPITGARVRLDDGINTLERTTDDQGVAELVLGATGSHDLSIEAEGYVAHRQTVTAASEPWTIALTPELPEGEIKGKVRALRGGKPLRAHVVIQPLGTAVDTDAEGNFRVTVPPGTYKLAISADGYEAQERPAMVERLGVTILVVDLRRASP